MDYFSGLDFLLSIFLGFDRLSRNFFLGSTHSRSIFLVLNVDKNAKFLTFPS